MWIITRPGHSLVVKSKSLKLILALAAAYDLELYGDDVRTAYLNAKIPTDEVIYMRQPRGYEQANRVCRLVKALYSLKQSAQLLNQDMHRTLT